MSCLPPPTAAKSKSLGTSARQWRFADCYVDQIKANDLAINRPELFDDSDYIDAVNADDISKIRTQHASLSPSGPDPTAHIHIRLVQPASPPPSSAATLVSSSRVAATVAQTPSNSNPASRPARPDPTTPPSAISATSNEEYTQDDDDDEEEEDRDEEEDKQDAVNILTAKVLSLQDRREVLDVKHQRRLARQQRGAERLAKTRIKLENVLVELKETSRKLTAAKTGENV